MNAATPRHDLAALVGASDPGSTRLVYAMILGLVLVGLAFIGLAIWLIRRTRVDPEVLAPLERMGDSAWLKRDSSTQRRLLDEVRPAGAVPLRAEPAAPTIDKEFDEQSQRPAASLSDLGPGVPSTSESSPDPVATSLDPVESVDPVDLIEQDLADPVEPDLADPVEADDPVETNDPVDPVDSVDAVEPVVPATPVEPVSPEPVEPVSVGPELVEAESVGPALDEPAAETAG